MAERRMFAKTIIDSDAFLELPQSTQLLYFHLAMRADDDGFINKPKSILRLTGCGEEDMNRLVQGDFLIAFDSGVVVIRHWRMHNRMRKDTYKETIYKEEKAKIAPDERGVYHETDHALRDRDESVTGTLRMRDGFSEESLRKDRIGKDRLGQVSSGQDIIGGCGQEEMLPPDFTPPSVTEVLIYCKQRKNNIDPERFVAYYAARGWKGVSNWQETLRSWEGRWV